jgi:hypothetical protein
MATNLDRFKDRLKELVIRGKRLEHAMLRSADRSAFDQKFEKLVGEDGLKELVDKLPDFHKTYDAWYSESLAVVKQLLPDRVANFVSLYEKPKSRKEINNGNYVIQDFLQGIIVTFRDETKVQLSAAIPQYRQQMSILEAANARFESVLFDIGQLVRADLFDSEIDAARELLKNKFLRAAGAIGGVVLEKHLHQVCEDHSVAVSKKNPSIGDLNDLLKANSVIDVPQWRYISLMADIRNLSDHDRKVEPTVDQIKDLLDGVSKILKTIF